MPKISYSIGEWYGRSVAAMSADELHAFARDEALDQFNFSKKTCPPRCSDSVQFRCNKRHGVCTIRGYVSSDGEALVAPGPAGRLITICPNRFEEDEIIYTWISETLLATSDAFVLPEIKFLAKPASLDASQQASVGKIDNILVKKDVASNLEWCAVEKQAVYFSGKAMGNEWDHISKHPGKMPFPIAHRHPDFRSSGVKRLMPQLQIKVPTLRRWGIKMAVVVDDTFFDSLGAMSESSHLSNSDVAWFIVRYDEGPSGARLVRDRVVFTTLDDAVSGLTAGVPVPKEVFEDRIRQRLKKVTKAKSGPSR